MKVRNMIGRTGKPVPNQFTLYGDDGWEYFQSYNSMVARQAIRWTEDGVPERTVELDEVYWDYSTTTSKYLGKFLGMPMAAVREAVKDGVFVLADLNGVDA